MRYRWSPGVNLTPIWVLLGVNFMVFVATYAVPEATYLFGLNPAALLDRPWTIVTNMFVHAGFGHIFTNMLMLFFFGSYLLRLIGEGKFLMVYFVGGLVGNILYILLGPNIPVVGASGALYGVMGALAVMRPRLKVYVWFLIPMDLWMVVLFGGFLLSLPFVASQGIAWQAHLGGLAVGLVAGYFFRKKEHQTFWS